MIAILHRKVDESVAAAVSDEAKRKKVEDVMLRGCV
jgi:hypothetical protein